jgi:hypothetical protein
VGGVGSDASLRYSATFQTGRHEGKEAVLHELGIEQKENTIIFGLRSKLKAGINPDTVEERSNTFIRRLTNLLSSFIPDLAAILLFVNFHVKVVNNHLNIFAVADLPAEAFAGFDRDVWNRSLKYLLSA